MSGSDSEITRRVLLRNTGFAAVAAGGLGLSVPRAAHAAQVAPKLAWTYKGNLVRRPASTSATEQVFHPTLMKVSDKIGATYDSWYLWHWTHDAPIARLYSAARPTGPFTYRGLLNLPSPPSGWEPDHFSAGDVVWDPVTRYFYSTPHSETLGSFPQATFLIRSSDGINWTYVTDGPIVSPTAGAWDDYQTAYGRFLRDYYGNLQRYKNRIIWYYRGQKANPHGYRIGYAYSFDFLSWTKARNNPLFNPNQSKLCSLGSALSVNGKYYLVLSTAPGARSHGNDLIWLKQSTGVDGPYVWTDGAGILIFDDPQSTVFTESPSYVVDPANGKHYIAYADQEALGLQTQPYPWAVQLAVGVP